MQMMKVVPQVDPLGTVAEHEIADIKISRKPWFNVSIAASLPMRHQDISLKLGDALVSTGRLVADTSPVVGLRATRLAGLPVMRKID